VFQFESIEIRDVSTGYLHILLQLQLLLVKDFGLGRHIEEEAQNSTGENLDPCRWKGPNDTVDVGGKYTEITWSSATGGFSGWAPHENAWIWRCKY
jgi:hypothetical protein